MMTDWASPMRRRKPLEFFVYPAQPSSSPSNPHFVICYDESHNFVLVDPQKLQPIFFLHTFVIHQYQDLWFLFQHWNVKTFNWTKTEKLCQKIKIGYTIHIQNSVQIFLKKTSKAHNFFKRFQATSWMEKNSFGH